MERPRCFVLAGHLHSIESIVRQWQIDTDWWEPTGRVWCDYYLVTTTDGLFVVIYYDRLTQAWFLSDFYD
jgi:hypothetical protein